MANLTNINNKFLVTTGGNVGIGTTAPLVKLDVRGNAYVTGYTVGFSGSPQGNYAYRLTNDAGNSFINVLGGNLGIGTASPSRKLTIGNGNGFVNNQISLLDGGGTEQATIAVETTTANDLLVASKANLRFFTGSTIGGTTTLPTNERMRIDSSGNVSLNGGLLGLGNAASTPNIGYGMFHYSGVGLGIYSSASGATQGIGFWLNNGSAYEAGRFLSNGNLGIGTTSPANKLTVSASNTGTQITTNPVGKFINTGNSFSKLIVGSDNNNFDAVLSMDNNSTLANTKLRIYIGNGTNATTGHSNDHIVLQGDGNVGIGTTTPSNKLDVKISTSNRTTLEPVLTVSAEGSGPYTGFGPKISFNSNIYYGAATGNPAGIIETAYIGAVMGTTYATNSDLVLATRDGATSVTEKMRILGNGNVGIGTTNPGHKLEVNGGTALVGGGFYVSSDQSIITSSIYTFRDAVYINNPNSTSAAVSANSVMSIGASSGNSVNTSLITTGAVGIGTSSPNKTLAVNGEIFQKTRLNLQRGSSGATTLIQFLNEVGTDRAHIDFGGTNEELSFFAGAGSSEHMRITAAGTVGIGTADGPGDVNAKLHVYKQAGDNTVNELLRLDCGENNHNVGKGGAIVFRDINVYTDTAKIIAQRIGNTGGSTLQFSLRGGEKMRIKSDGNVGIGTTSPTYKLHVASSNNVSIFEDTSNASGAAFIVFNRPGVFSMGSITRNGSANSVSYNTGSDYRLKEDLKDFNALDLVNNITAYDYKWKDIEQRDYGFIAHELKQTLPNVVTGEKDGEKMQGVDYSKLTPILLKAIQELEARVKELENK